MKRLSANDSEIIMAVLSGIATHPLILEPPIYHPVDLDEDDNPVQMKIGKLRTYAGKELTDVNSIVLSVYPIPRSMEMGVPHSVMCSPYLVGNSYPEEYLDKCMINICVELHFFDPNFDEAVEVNVYQNRNYQLTTFHGDQMDYKDGESLSNPLSELVTPPQILGDTDFNPTISIIPAEEIVRKYGSLLRSVIRDQRTFKPWNLRNPCVKWTDYLTSEIFESRSDDNLIFHSVKLGLELEFYESNLTRVGGVKIISSGLTSERTPDLFYPPKAPSPIPDTSYPPINPDNPIITDHIYGLSTPVFCRLNSHSSNLISIQNINYYKGSNFSTSFVVSNITSINSYKAVIEITDREGSELLKFWPNITDYPSNHIIIVETSEPAETFEQIQPGLYLLTLMLIEQEIEREEALVVIRGTIQILSPD